VIDHPLSGAMQRLNVLLRHGLFRDEGNVRPARRRADRLGVIAVVLLPAYEGLYIRAQVNIDETRFYRASIRRRNPSARQRAPILRTRRATGGFVGLR
jgi:hypothetical protein